MSQEDRSDTGRTVEISVDVAAPPEVVYRFLSDAGGLRAWLGEGADVDPVPGGRLRVRYPSGDVAAGTVEEVVASKRLVFTWGYENRRHGLGPGESRVTVTLAPRKGGTRVTLVHTGLPDDEAAVGHRRGWRHYASVLAARAAAEVVGPRVGPAVDDFVAAWNADDLEDRRRYLSRCFAMDGVFRDSMACLSGRDQLLEYIEGARGFMPDTRLVLAGEPDHVHDHVRFPWRFEGADGTVVGTGWDVATMGPEGRFTEVVGFWDPAPSASG